MTGLDWSSFDADEPDPQMQRTLRKLAASELVAKNVLGTVDSETAENFAAERLQSYADGSARELNETMAVNVFRPHEFDSVSRYDNSLTLLLNWCGREPFDWSRGSRTVQVALDASFPSGGSKRVAGGREAVVLDNLVAIEGCKVAVEIETSNNLDNGYFTLRLAVREAKADYGVMIVPWTSEGPGRADEGRALGRLDREFDGSESLRDGPIYRIAIVRKLDIYRLLAERKL